jgi:hypothetical protein
VIAVAFVSLPDLTVEVVEQRYRTVSTLGEGEWPGQATVEFAWDVFTAEIVVDAEGVVLSYRGRLADAGPAAARPDLGARPRSSIGGLRVRPSP